MPVYVCLAVHKQAHLFISSMTEEVRLHDLLRDLLLYWLPTTSDELDVVHLRDFSGVSLVDTICMGAVVGHSIAELGDV